MKSTYPSVLFLKMAGLVFFLLFTGPFQIKAQVHQDVKHHRGFDANAFDSTEKWNYHFQLTSIGQGHQRFYSKYSGANSLRDSDEMALSLTSTLFLGRKLWKGAAVFFNPELAGGKGISYALGLAGAANGETFRVGSPEPKLYVARAFIQQHFALNHSQKEFQEDENNQLSGYVPDSRISISAGKFSIADFFDDNAYSHDPRSEFLNWSLMSNGAWDYPANTRGYTWGIVAELVEPSWALRISSVMMPNKANGNVFDLNVAKSHAETMEFEKKFKIESHAGAIKILIFENFSPAPFYTRVIEQMKEGDTSQVAIISGKAKGQEYGRMKYGAGISFWQELAHNIGIFGRAGWNDGNTSTWAFTEIDRTVSGGVSIKAILIHRKDDVFGVAGVMNGISASHRAYLNAGGYGFMLGDGKLSRYEEELVLESFYKLKIASSLWATLDYQLIMNPGYNADRGPVNVFALRAHVEF